MGSRTFPPDRILAFGAGIALLLIIIPIAIFRPDLETNYLIRVVLSLAAAGFAAVIPGLLHFEPGRYLKAGGAMAVFAIVFWLAPRAVGPSGTELTVSVPEGTTLKAQVVLLAKGRQLAAEFKSCSAAQLGTRLSAGVVSGRSLVAVVENIASLADGKVIGSLKAVEDHDTGRLTVHCA